MGEGQPLSSAHQAPLDCSEPMAAQMSLVKLGGSENRIKRHSKEKDLYGGMEEGCCWRGRKSGKGEAREIRMPYIQVLRCRKILPKNYYTAAANNDVFGGLREISPLWRVWKTQKDLKTK